MVSQEHTYVHDEYIYTFIHMYLSINRKHTADAYIQKLRMGIEKTQIEFITNLLPNNITKNINKQKNKTNNTYKFKWNCTEDKPNN